MADFAVVQVNAPTSTGTFDFTESGFGTPQGAIFFLSRGVTNGTVIDGALLVVGATDGTNSRCLSGMSKDGANPSLTRNHDSTTQCVFVTDGTVGTKDGAAVFDSWLSNGVRLNCTDNFPAAYKINGILMGGSGVSDVYVNHASTPGVVDTATTITTVPFQPDIVLTFSHTTAIDDSGSAPNGMSMGFVANDGATPPQQRSVSFNDTDNVTTTAVQCVVDTDSVIRRAVAGAGGAEAQIQEFAANGFKLYQRIQATVIPLIYVAIKLNGISAKVITSASPVATGSHTITGAGFTPQFGLMLHNAVATANTVQTDPTAEVLGISAFTAAASASSSFWCDDAVVTPSLSNTESVTDYGTTTSGVTVNLRRDVTDFMKATFTAFTSDGVTMNYSVTSATARQRAVLFVQESSAVGPIALTGSAATSSRGTTAPNFEIPL